MTSTTIKDWQGKVLGFIKIDERTGDKTVQDWQGKVLGYYVASADQTRTWRGRVIAKGDQSSMLFGMADSL